MVKYALRTDSNKYLSYLYNNSISTTSDYSNAIRVNSLEDARTLKRLVSERDSTLFNVVCITVNETVISDVENEGGEK